MAKTGSEGGRWVELERPKPPKVNDMYRFWSHQPWLRQIQRGWLLPAQAVERERRRLALLR